MDFTTWIILGVVVGLAIAIIQISVTSQKKKGMEEKLHSLGDFTPNQKIMGNDGNSGLAIDEKRKKICLIKQSSGNVVLDVMSYKDMLSSEIFEDGNTITRTSRTSQLGGSLVGGLALGGVGAVIGGLSGKKISSNKVTRVDLRLTVNRTNSPVHDINFMNVEGQKNGFIHKSALQQARHWHGLAEVLIRRADEVDERLIENKQKKCPMCAENIKFEAVKCRYCGYEFDPLEVKKDIDKYNNDVEIENNIKKETTVLLKEKTKTMEEPIIPSDCYVCDECNFFAKKNEFKESNLFCPECGSPLEET